MFYWWLRSAWFAILNNLIFSFLSCYFALTDHPFLTKKYLLPKAIQSIQMPYPDHFINHPHHHQHLNFIFRIITKTGMQNLLQHSMVAMTPAAKNGSKSEIISNHALSIPPSASARIPGGEQVYSLLLPLTQNYDLSTYSLTT